MAKRTPDRSAPELGDLADPQPAPGGSLLLHWWVALLPLAVGILLSLLLTSPLGEALPGAQSQIYLTADVAGLAWVIGLAIAVAIAAGLVLWWAVRRHCGARLAQARAAAAEERRRFLRRLDHELKNPLTAIRVTLANLAATSAADPVASRVSRDEGTGPGDAEARDAVATLEAQTARIGGLVADLRKLAELETRPLTFDVVDLSDVLTEVAAAAAEAGSDGGIRKACRVTLTLPQAPWPLPVVDGDWDLLFLAVYNLVANACKFTAPGDTIELRAFEDGRDVVIEVADTGPGIPEAEQALVWEELYRAEGARGTPGSGLGLALVRTIASRHGGSATLRSREGQGTVVALRLPVRQG